MVNESFYLRQYESQEGDTRLVMDVMSVYMYPLETFTITDAVNRVEEIKGIRISEIIKHLMASGLVIKHVTGNYSLIPELNFILFPLNIKQARYATLLERTRYAVHAFYSISARIQDLQQVLVAYFTGDRFLLSPPVRKIELELSEYQPYLSYLLYFPVYAGLLAFFSQESMDKIVSFALKYNLLKMPPVEELEAFARQYGQDFPELMLLQGQLQIAPADKTADDLYAQAVILLYQRQPEKALAFFEKGIKRQRQYDKKNTLPLSPLFAFYYAFTLAVLPGEHVNALITKIVSAYERKLFPAITPAICLLHFHAGRKEKGEQLLLLILEGDESSLLSYLSVLCLQLLHPKSKLLRNFSMTAARVMNLGMERHYRLLTYEYLYLFKGDDYQGYASLFQEAGAIAGYPPVFSQMEQTPDWERLLNTLLGADSHLTKKEKQVVATRLIYLVDFDHYKIQPVLQTSQGSNTWSSGRNVALKKLKEGKAEAMTEQDLHIGATVQKDHYYNYDGESYSFAETVWEEIAGHPLLFSADDITLSVEIIKAQPELSVNKTGHGYTFSANIDDYVSETVFVKETNTRLKVIHLTAQQRRLLQTLQQIPVVPAAGKDKLIQVLKSIGAHLTIHADMGDIAANINKRPGDSRIVIQLLPLGDGLKAGIYVKPFTIDPPYCKPGIGAHNIIGISNGERWQAIRDLAKEKTNVTALLNLIQGAIEQDLGDDTIIFEDPLDCLQLLEIIHQYPELVRAEWPEGERYKVRQQAGFAQLSISLKEKDHWFMCTGELKIDEMTVLALKDLLDTTRTVKKRFIALQNGEYLALTGDLRRRLNEMSSVANIDQQDISIQPYAAPVLDELLEQAGSVTTDAAWKAFSRKRSSAMELAVTVPDTLQTELRPYQEEGFRWMTHLAAWGAGACLADDMGLGKTIQAIALLLHRAPDGPALVICPASVVTNWSNEIARFAPSLNVILLHNGHRATLIKSAGPFDVVITTYGLLQAEEKLLARVKWPTLVLDEAHTIKNFQTKTSKAAMAMQAGFKLMLTGTPIQNHMGEIWNLFNFLNPGLLGSLDHFNKQFVFPSVRNPESTVKQHLKKLIAPFILRRTKTGVLDELPPKTEIVKLVPLSSDEASFYEALRRKALENIKAQEGSMAQQHIRALAEISRLRMAACHPQLVDAESEIPSSKLSVFREIVEELVSNQHRALVFSQFVKHLDLVKQLLNHLGITYLYLDGSTPLSQRDKLVKDFQAGKAQLFLISLKAGGLGLNLTAADYVIHMDPWWNPAIEEQASDRAHRIGQTRPVTIYRLVAQYTIEEKIIALHNSKRDLADQLLEGSDQAGKLNARELLDLIADHSL
ncbi:DEAD/DEAH box helicase [Chitinophaga arvensicola]|uniref:Superfamily II DNA or RNA helicase, SNF2 family n=1 Tax=Chitinophaga arvensicola TaxID=29529 RepID=A0A1I0SAE8_9BACT|nr:DEAD/DEAH box helicase [Chitinophaga arvensicola]SEW53420.1 Superfamily II DNA or RNA helicase, SNF2 family [Chitinophaga arvensicola]